MTRIHRITLASILCIFISGLLVSYKSFETYENSRKNLNEETSGEISVWVAESVEQKLQQLEASVSYLDKSTVESLKRFGARYFAYAYEKEGQWGVKWKVLNNDFPKDRILSEVNELNFDEMANKQRTWTLNKKEQAIYVVPVELAKSHQLTSGFLVFGLNKSFFNFVKKADESIVIINKALEAIHQKLNSEDLNDKSLFSSDQMQLGVRHIRDKDDITTMTSFFSPMAQLWFVNQRTIAAHSFLLSSYFAYSLIGTLLASVLLLIFTTQVRGEARGTQLKFKRPSLKMPTMEGFFTKKGEPVEKDSRGELRLERINDFSNFLDEILSEELERLSKVGVSIKTQVEEGATLFCSPQHVKDLLERLIGNSVLALENEEQKEIQIQLVEQNESFQLIYVDTRTDYFPTGQEPSLLLQTEGSLTGIDGIIAYASWLFGEGLTVAKKGFCLSVDLQKHDNMSLSKQESLLAPVPEDAVALVDTLDRIEIRDSDTDLEMMDQFAPVNSLASLTSDPESERLKDNLEELNQEISIDELVENFELKEFQFSDEQEESEESESVILEEESTEAPKLETDDKGMFEFNTGQFKIKVRSPKKRDMDVDS